MAEGSSVKVERSGVQGGEQYLEGTALGHTLWLAGSLHFAWVGAVDAVNNGPALRMLQLFGESVSQTPDHLLSVSAQR